MQEVLRQSLHGRLQAWTPPPLGALKIMSAMRTTIFKKGSFLADYLNWFTKMAQLR